MYNIDVLRFKIKPYLKDLSLTDAELNHVIINIVDEIAIETKLFRKLYGFSVHEDIERYNLRYIGRMNEEVEEEPTDIIIGDPAFEDIVEFIREGTFPEIPVEKNLKKDKFESNIIDIIDIFDDRGYSVVDKFEERGTTWYFCHDEEWRKLNDEKQFVFTAVIVPEIEELHNEELKLIGPAVLAGAKFHLHDILHSSPDVQASNYDYLRWEGAKKKIMDMYPQFSMSPRQPRKWAANV